MKKAIILASCAVLLLAAQSAFAHSFWINAYESKIHKPYHVTTSIGYGHSMPLDDFLFSGKQHIPTQEFFLAGPDGTRSALALPKADYNAPEAIGHDLTRQSGDLALQKINLGKDTPQGTYQLAASLRDNYFTMYVDTNGKRRKTIQSMDAIKDAKRILKSLYFSGNAKSSFTVGKWTHPAPLGFNLEIVPMTDLTKVHVGDMVRFQVLLDGKPVSSSYKGLERITAHSPNYGDPDHFCLMAKIFKGMGQFRMPASGQWMVRVAMEKDVEKDSPMHGKAQSAYYMTTYTFRVAQ